MAKLTTLPQLQSNTTRLASFVSSALSTVAGAIEEIDDAKANKSAVQTFQFDSNGATLYGGTGNAIFIIPSSTTTGGGTVTKLDPQLTLSPTALTNTGTVTATYLGDGELSVDYDNKITVTVEGKNISANTHAERGEFTVTVNLSATDEYTAATAQFTIKTDFDTGGTPSYPMPS